MFLSWIQRPVKALFGRPRLAARASGGPRKVRLSLEALEGRTLPSALTVPLFSAPNTGGAALLSTDSGHNGHQHKNDSSGGEDCGCATL